MEDELEDEESVQQVLEHAHEHPDGALLSSHQTAWSEAAPQPLITSTLQQQASQLFHCSPKQTMSIAQRLYEAGHITYMRTDKAVMSEEAKEEARKWIIEQYGEAYVASSHPNPAVPSVDPPKKIRRPKTKESDKKESMAQEAHEAIRPTHLDVTSLSADQWGPSERKVYELISRRALQSVMAPARGHILHLRIQMDELEDFPWKAEYKRTEFDGWKRLGTVAALEEDSSNHSNHSNDDEKDPTWDQWCSLQPGDRLQWTVVKGQEKETRSQTRFTEATLVRELERHGIGRPSTFASLLSVIQDKRYVEVTDIPPTEKAVKEYSIHEGEWPYRVETKKKKVGAEKRKLVPTALGRSVWEWMKLHFEDLFAYDFTATMEKQLDHIADGSVKRSAVLQTMWESYADRYQALSKVSSLPAHRADPADPADPTHPSPLSSKQRAFIGGLKAVQTKKGPLLLREGEPTVFFGWPKGVSWESMTEEKALAYERQKIQEQHEKEHPEQVHEFRGKPVYKKTGPYGVYLQWGSVNLPWIEGEQTEELEQRLDQKPVSSVIKDLKSYVIRNGQYGPYIMKKTQTKTQTAKKPVCVSLPKGMDPEKLTDKEVDHLYKAGCEQKKAGPKKQEKKKKTDEE
jgi:DNA topoisomerase-1